MSEASWGGARRSGAGAKRKSARDTCTGAEELAASSLEAAWRFPPAQRLFVLFLEAADSHRLTTCLIRCFMLGMRTRGIARLWREVVSSLHMHTCTAQPLLRLEISHTA